MPARRLKYILRAVRLVWSLPKVLGKRWNYAGAIARPSCRHPWATAREKSFYRPIARCWRRARKLNRSVGFGLFFFFASTLDAAVAGHSSGNAELRQDPTHQHDVSCHKQYDFEPLGHNFSLAGRL